MAARESFHRLAERPGRFRRWLSTRKETEPMKMNLMRAALMIGGCTGLLGWSQPGQAQSPPPGMTPKARVCQVEGGRMEARVAPPKTVTVSNEGGWCNDYRFAGGEVPFQVVRQP